MIAVVATSNKHKIEEIKNIVSKFSFEVISLKEAGVGNVEVEEDGETFEENSKKKATEIGKICNKIAIADDSGLCVSALNDAPGVYSARFSGEDATDETNNKKLLELMKNEENRSCKFVSVITMVFPNGEVVSARGECHGTLLKEERGNGGFGYDPLFMPVGYDKTFGELSQDEKNKISHRALALEELSKLLKNKIW